MILKSWFNSAHQFHRSSLKSKKVGKKMCTVRSPCTPCALHVCPIVLCTPCAPPWCNPMRDPPFDHRLTAVLLRPFWNWFGILILQEKRYWSSKSKMSLGYWSSKSKRYWSSKWKMSLGYWSSAFFGPFCRGLPFFQQAGREGSDQKIFLPRVPNFKSDHSGWLRCIIFYTQFTQI